MTAYTPTQQLPIGQRHPANRRRVALAVALALLVAALLAALLYTAGRYGGAEPTVVAGDGLVGNDAPAELPSLDLDPLPAFGNDDEHQEADTDDVDLQPDTAPDPEPTVEIDEPQPTTSPVPSSPVEPVSEPEPEPTPSNEPPDPLSDEEEDALDPAIPDDVPEEPPPFPAEELEPELPEPEPTPDPVDLDPVDGVGDDLLCHDVELAGKTLYVQTPVVLDAGSMSSTVSIMNCGDDIESWTSLAPPWVTLDAASGELTPGGVTQLGFSVTPGSVDAGAFDFPIKLNTQTEFNAAQVHGFRATVGSDLAGPDSLSNGPATCNDPCIRNAELRNSPVSTDVILDIETTTPANVVVMLSTITQVIGPDGKPFIPVPQVSAVSDGSISEWTTVLTGLTPATPYNIIVQAIDEAGNKWVESGSFTTSTTVHPGEKAVEPLGCKVQCIDSAMVSFGEAFDIVYVEVNASPAADIVAMISTQAPFYSAGVPQFSNIEASGGSNGPTTFLSHSLPVTPGTLYHIIVKATDDQGRSSYQVGAFNAPSPPPPPPVPETLDVVVTPLRLWVTEDGDDIGRGELTFPWQVGTNVNYRREERMNTGDSFWFPYWASYHFDDIRIDDYVPLIAISAWERDPDGNWSAGQTTPPTVPEIDPVDGIYPQIDTIYTTAYRDSLIVGEVAGLASCASYGVAGEWADERCIELVSIDPGHWDHPTFRAVVAIQAAPVLGVP